MHIPLLDLKYKGKKVGFAIKTMEEIDLQNKGINDVPHRHNYYTVLWARKACGTHHIDYKEHPIQPNIVFFVGPGQVHKVETKPEPVGWVILFTKEFLQENYIPESFIKNLGLFSDITDTPPLTIDKKTEEKLADITSHLQQAFEEDNLFKDTVLGAYLKLFLIECNRLTDSKQKEISHSVQSGKSIVLNFKELLESNFHTWHQVSKYAEDLAISPDYLNNVIKTSTGKNAKEFIQERILLEAKRLGVHTDLSSKQIAYQLGFDDPSYFSKFYKNIEGISFTEFRNKLEKEIIGSSY